MARVQLEGVRKSFGRVEAIRGVDLAIGDGEFAVFVGPSGCGKSTLLRLVAGLETVSAGEIRIGEDRVTETEPAARGVAMVFQSYALYPHMDVYRNIAFGLTLARTGGEEIRARVHRVAEMLEIAELLDRKPRQLSGGQRQRVAIARAIVREPRVFLFDEPLSNLDAGLRAQTRLELARMHRRMGVTTIYVTHDQTEAMTLADRLVVLNAGRVEQEGPPIELYRRPATQFVASFLGSPRMNLLHPSALAVEGLPAGTATVGLRPEEVEIGEDGPAATVELVEELGESRIVHAVLADGSAVAIRHLPETAPEPGTAIHLTFRPEALHAFDGNGLRLGDRESR
ncbi:ABC transporter ATP-binding protein [Allostella sp. ATCC 35155]|nr:ABC transporter ATP-binding protein [Stella sp. ATCC 35155]